MSPGVMSGDVDAGSGMGKSRAETNVAGPDGTATISARLSPLHALNMTSTAATRKLIQRNESPHSQSMIEFVWHSAFHGTSE